MPGEGSGGSLEKLAYAAREIAVASAEKAIRSVIQDLLKPVEEDNGGSVGILSQGSGHAGAPARRIDALAHAAARRAAEQKWMELRPALEGRVRDVAYVGEEAGTQTQVILPRTLIIRSDPLDGTSNAVNMLNAFGSVISVDIVEDAKERPRHLAGAIIGGEIDVSWFHWSRRSRQTSRYLRPLGSVLVRSVRANTGWRNLDVAQDERDTSCVASVAASEKRFAAFAHFRNKAFADGGTVYHLAGNPLCSALLLGHVGAFVETQKVTLHDSVFLIPHWILGGRIETLKFEFYDYIYEYEKHAVDFNPGFKPITPFIAYVGEVNPFKDVVQADTRDPSPTTGAARRRVFRVP